MKYQSKIVQLYAVVFWIGVFVSVCFCIFGKFIIYVLRFLNLPFTAYLFYTIF